MAMIDFKITDDEGLDCYVRIWNAAGEFYHWSTQTFKAWNINDQPYLMMDELAVVGVGKSQYIASVQADDLNSSPETMYYSWAVCDNGTPDQFDNPISFVYEIPITEGREGAWAKPGDSMGLADSVQTSIASRVWTATGRIISGFASTAISQLTNKIGPAIGYSPVDKDGNINLVCGDDYAAVDGRAIVLTHKVSNPDIDITGATVTLYYSKPTSEEVGTLTGVVHVPTGRVAVKFEPSKVQTAAISPDYYGFVVVVRKDGRDLTTFEGKLTMTKYRLAA